MITAVDTSVLLDLLTADKTFGMASRQAIRRAIGEGRIVACDAVFAEVMAAFGAREQAVEALRRLGLEYEPVQIAAAMTAGDVFREYRARGGKPDRVVADFLIGAHAQHQADRLLTRDRGFHRAYFAGLEVIDPSTAGDGRAGPG